MATESRDPRPPAARQRALVIEDALVTENTDLLKRLVRSPSACEVWRFEDFRGFVEAVQPESS